ncbi:MAG: FAD binding domain-containing protein [Candidatus Caldarchaeum sp.]|nr:FAD binding domain-containing protein [Candidatus Caldarchaeum sp.]
MLCELPSFAYAEPSTVEEAVKILDIHKPYAKALAGGTELLNLMKDRVSGSSQPLPKVLVNVKKIRELKEVYVSGDGWLVLGAAATLEEVAANSFVKAVYHVLSEACSSVATQQIRSVATVGGNLCQRPWCWYFRHPYFDCFKKGGKLCYAVAGEHQHHFSVMNLGVCIAGHPSDLAPALLALDANIQIASVKGRRKIPVSEFYLDGRSQQDTVLDTADLIVNVQVPPTTQRRGMAFAKARLRDTWDFAMANAAAVLELDGRTCVGARVAMGGLSPYPFRLRKVEAALEGENLESSLSLYRLIKQAFSDAKTLPMTREKKNIGTAVLLETLCRAAGLPVF